MILEFVILNISFHQSVPHANITSNGLKRTCVLNYINTSNSQIKMISNKKLSKSKNLPTFCLATTRENSPSNTSLNVLVYSETACTSEVIPPNPW